MILSHREVESTFSYYDLLLLKQKCYSRTHVQGVCLFEVVCVDSQLCVCERHVSLQKFKICKNLPQTLKATNDSMIYLITKLWMDYL